MMQTLTEKQSQKTPESGVGCAKTEMIRCLRIREKLDSIFDGSSRLEETHETSKQILFDHLRTCKKCCRSFDTRARIRSPGRNRIF
jgi:hypothetical protein